MVKVTGLSGGKESTALVFSGNIIYDFCTMVKAKKTKKTIKNNKLNDLTGSEWLFFTNTLWETSYSPDSTHRLRKVHGAVKPPEAMAELVRFFSRRGERILDPFAGVGGVLLGAELEGRLSVGVELEHKWTAVFRRIKDSFVLEDRRFVACGSGDLPFGTPIQAEMVEDCCLHYLEQQEPESFHAIITDPPYGVQHKQTFAKETNFAMSSENKLNFGELATFEEYLELMGRFGELAYKVLKPERYLVVLVGDRYIKGEFLPLGIQVADALRKQGFELKGVKIWWNKVTLRPFRPYAVGSCFVPNITHQNVLILRKKKVPAPKKRRGRRPEKEAVS